jgi:Flp pilus assembly protein TadG
MTKPARQGLARLCRDEAGATAVEFALVASAFIGLCTGILGLGWGLQVRNELSHAADRVVRFVVMTPTASNAAVEKQLRDALPHYDPELLEVATSTVKPDTVEYRVVTLSYPFALDVPGMPGKTLTLTVSRRAPLL